MIKTFYNGAATKRSETPVAIPDPPSVQQNRPEGYIADEGLIDAVNIALHLGQPLLLTGQPGTGKTQLAYSLAWALNLGSPLKFETKSTSVAKDLFYTYDALSHLQATQSNASARAVDFIRWNALGEAILKANTEDSVGKIYQPANPNQWHTRSVVLIDEIDKAPRDFPNDLLNEIEYMYFRIPELGNQRIDTAIRPILILTSNSEKNLPEAFLRRCVFYNVPFPTHERLLEIVNRRLGDRALHRPELVDQALDLFNQLRSEENGMTKHPATSELLAWLHVLCESRDENVPLTDPRQVEPALCTLVKLVQDRQIAKGVIEAWQKQK